MPGRSKLRPVYLPCASWRGEAAACRKSKRLSRHGYGNEQMRHTPKAGVSGLTAIPAPSSLRPQSPSFLIFAIFPTFYSIVFALSRVRIHEPTDCSSASSGCRISTGKFFGNDQVHFLGKIEGIGAARNYVRCSCVRRRALVALPVSANHHLGRHDRPLSSRPPRPSSLPGSWAPHCCPAIPLARC